MNTFNTGVTGLDTTQAPTVPADKPKASKASKASKAGAHGKSAAKAAKAPKPKADVDPINGCYINLKRWPTKQAGPVPGRYELALAYALGVSQPGRPTKKVLATAAYLRPDAANYSVQRVTQALFEVLGGVADDDMRNVATKLVSRGVCKKHVTYADNSRGDRPTLAYRLEITPKGWGVVKAFCRLYPAFDAVINAQKAAVEAEKPAATPEAVLPQGRPGEAATAHA
jgi:hypothetical protein